MDDFKKLPKMQCFKEGGHAKPKAMCYGGKMKKGGEVDAADIKQDKAVVKKAFKMHDAQEHKGDHTDLSKLRKGGRMKKEGATVRKYKEGGAVGLYGSKKKSGDLDSIQKAIDPVPKKADAKSAAVKKFADGGLTGKDLEDAIVLNRITNARKYLGPAQQAEFAKQGLMGTCARLGAGTMQIAQQAKGMGATPTMPAVNQMGDATGNIGYKRGGKIKKMADGGSLKEVDANDNPGLAKLPTTVRNKMGYMKSGRKVC
jgi:hypothetical protein